MLTNAIKIAVVALLASLVVLVAFVCVWVDTLNRVTCELPIVADRAFAREGMLTRAAAERQITSVRHDLFQRVDALQDRTFAELDQIRDDANQQISDTRTAVVAEIAKVSTPAGAAITETQTLIVPARHILAVAGDNADLLGDCDHNPDCLANRLIPVLKSTEKIAKAGERTMNAVAEATPETAQAVKSTSQDMSKIVKEFSQPVSWVKGLAGTAASIAGKFLGL